MSTDIYYFTGTGNSLAVARDIAARTGGRLRSIAASVRTRGPLATGADCIGIVFPVYHKGLPLILRPFMAQLGDLASRYLFAVCTYGDSTGFALRDLRRLAVAANGDLALALGVRMPYNYLTPRPILRGFVHAFHLRQLAAEQRAALLAAAPARTAEIAAWVNAWGSGIDDTRVDPLTRLADRFRLEDSLGKQIWLRVAGLAAPLPAGPFSESRRQMDRGFWADDACTACGVCVRVCPVNNVRLADGRPTWGGNCEQCFACLQWCPQAAIQFGHTQADAAGMPATAPTTGEARYHHPDVTLADMIHQAAGQTR